MSKYMLENQDNVKVYKKFLDFEECFFKNGVSVFNKDLNLFEDDEVFKEYEKRIIVNYIDDNRHNIDKYKVQLSGSSEKFRHFFANLIWLYNLPVHDKSFEKKRYELTTYLDGLVEDSVIEDTISNIGVASYGLLRNNIYENVNFIYFFTKQYISNPEVDFNQIITNLDSSQKTKDINPKYTKNIQALASRHMLNYLFNPDYYEPIVDTSCKKKIVESFKKKYNPATLDDDIYQIRVDSFGMDESLLSHACKNDYRMAKITNGFNNSDGLYDIKIHPKIISTTELLAKEEMKIKNGLEAEELVYNNILKNMTPKDKMVLVNKILEIYNFSEPDAIMQNIDKYIHYSKYYNTYAPFDLFSVHNDDILYIEVKSTMGNELYFSEKEILFAYAHIDNYAVKVVKDKYIYEIDVRDMIEETYSLIVNSNPLINFSTIKYTVEFL